MKPRLSIINSRVLNKTAMEWYIRKYHNKSYIRLFIWCLVLVKCIVCLMYFMLLCYQLT